MILCLAKHVRRNFWVQHQWNYRCNTLMAIALTLLSSQVGYNQPVPSQHKIKRVCINFHILELALGIGEKRCFYVRSFAYWRKRSQGFGSLRSVCSSVSSTSYNTLFTRPSLFNNLLIKGVCIFRTLRYFLTACRLP